jgi:superfamily II DNA/RNA helicase
LVLDGREKDCTKEDIRNNLKNGSIRLVFCSDAASEGLNLQSARVLINVDVPWTPSRLEQRIGRIARLGQVANAVDVYNVWYPSSIEARMYRRIQKRLQESNIAIGEFPEVVADGIKNAILDDSEVDNSAEELQEIRNSVQTKALEELWSIQELEKTSSKVIRERMIETCKKHCVRSKYDNGIWTFDTRTGSRFEATDQDGQPESISFATLCENNIDRNCKTIQLFRDGDGNPCAYILEGKTEAYLDYEDITMITEDNSKSSAIPFERYPKMLPNPRNMNLSFSIETELPDLPNLWPVEEKIHES